MPQISSSYTTTLPNGNRVTVKVGSNRSGVYKTVTVRRRNGTSNSVTYRRGAFLTYLLGGYSDSIPRWATQPVIPAPARSLKRELRSTSATTDSHESSTKKPPKTAASFRDDYGTMKAEVLRGLQSASTPEAMADVMADAARRIQQAMARTPEFYVGELLNELKTAVVEQGNAELARCQRAHINAKAKADLRALELATRLTAARRAGDESGEHEIWRERERAQAELEATIDAATLQAELVGQRVEAVQRLASYLGFSFH